MANAPKTGFWHSLPGIMTATAGFLSAVTGALMGLNQAGVVDLKKLVGANPPAQTAPASAPTSNAPSGGASLENSAVDKSAQPKPEAAKIAPETTKSAELPATPSTKPADTKPSDAGTTQKVANANKPPEPVARPEQKPAPIDVKPIPSESKPVGGASPPPVPAPAETKPQPPASKPSDAKSQPAAQNPTSFPPSAPPKPALPPESKVAERPAETKRPEVRPPPPPVLDKVVPKPDERMANAQRVRPEEVPGVGKGKALSSGAAPVSPGVLDLTGLKMVIPPGWVKEEIRPEPMGPEAELRIPGPDGRGEDGVVRISHYMGTRGKEFEEKTIERWMGNVSRSGGAPVSRNDAKVSTMQAGSVKITMVELSGSVKISPRDISRPNHRFLGAIVEYPKGAHLVQVSGPTASMMQWRPTIEAFLKSARPE